jgi:hypothetical protein
LTKDRLLSVAKENLKEISESHIVNYNLGFSDHEHVNLLTIYATDAMVKDVTYFAGASGQLPKVARDATKRFGLRRFERNTEYAFSEAGDLGFDTVLKWAEELKEYWFNYYHLENGTIEVLGLTNFNLGSFIKVKERSKLFMIESINYSWSFGNPIVASLTVSHGIFEQGYYIDQATHEEITDTGTGYYENVTKEIKKQGK